jgi:hypothetical protein
MSQAQRVEDDYPAAGPQASPCGFRPLALPGMEPGVPSKMLSKKKRKAWGSFRFFGDSINSFLLSQCLSN